jgi:hypothetical protein
MIGFHWHQNIRRLTSIDYRVRYSNIHVANRIGSDIVHVHVYGKPSERESHTATGVHMRAGTRSRTWPKDKIRGAGWEGGGGCNFRGLFRKDGSNIYLILGHFYSHKTHKHEPMSPQMSIKWLNSKNGTERCTVKTSKSNLEVKHDFVRLKSCWFSSTRTPGSY